MKGQNIFSQRGVSVIVVVATLLILTIIGSVIASLVATWSDVSLNELRSSRAHYIAQSGIEYGIYTATKGGGWDEFTFAGRRIGEGEFTLTTNTSISSGLRMMTLESTGRVGGITDLPGAERKLRVIVGE